MKPRQASVRIGRYTHRYNESLQERSLKKHAGSFDHMWPNQNSGDDHDDHNPVLYDGAVSFSQPSTPFSSPMHFCSESKRSAFSRGASHELGTMLDSGGTYSAIHCAACCARKSSIKPHCTGAEDPYPPALPVTTSNIIALAHMGVRPTTCYGR